MTVLRYSGPFWFLASIPLLYIVADAGPFLTPAAILFALLFAERIEWKGSVYEESPAFRLLPIIYIPCQVLVIAWAAWASTTATPVAFASLVLSISVCTGVFGVLAAHEMVHSHISWHRQLGAIMLTGMTYPHFRIAHVHGHHRFAATARDPSTARLGESFYAFFLRTLVSQIAHAWRFERRRCGTQPYLSPRNRIIQDTAILAALYAALIFGWEWRAAVFLAAESAVAILVLELFNYVAHYGLQREYRGGHLEALGRHHSWNSSGLGNLLIFNMGRHSDHHRLPSASYETLQPAKYQPELPYGYAGSILLALMPPLWHAMMDPRVARLRAQPAKMRYRSVAPDSPTLRERIA